MLKRAWNWRPQTDRQKWLTVIAVAVLSGGAAAAIAVGPVRGPLLMLAGYSLLLGWTSTEGRRGRQARLALAARLDAIRPGEVDPAVVSLLRSGKKIQAIKRYRQLTGTSLHDAKTYIDSL